MKTKTKTSISIAQINAACCSEKNLRYKGDRTFRVFELIKEHIGEDVIAVTEVSSNVLSYLISKLGECGYRLFLDDSWTDIPLSDRYRYRCLTVLFVKDTVKFTQEKIPENSFPTPLRIVFGKLDIEDNIVYLRVSHIPRCDANTYNQLVRKERMLLSEVEYQKAHICDLAVSIGDFNGAANAEEGRFFCQNLYNNFTFSDMLHEDTFFASSCALSLDHVYVSGKALDELEITSKTVEKNVGVLGVLTDHKPICTTISLKH